MMEPATTATTAATTTVAPLTTTTALPGDGVDVPRLARETSRATRTAAREREVHARALGVSPTLEAIAAAELKAAQDVDPRVTVAAFERACDRARRAATLKPQAQTVLSGFTRLIDARLALTPAVVQALCAAVAHKDGAPDQLLDAIDRGPGDGAIVWPRPKNTVELVASLVRQLVLGGGASMQLQITSEHAAFLEEVLRAGNVPLTFAMGGAGAFASNVLSALPPVRPRFFSRDPLPGKIADRFAERVEIVDGDGAITTPQKHRIDGDARVNFSCEYSAGAPLHILGRKTLKVNGRMTTPVISGSGRVILGTKAKDVVPGFDGVHDGALQKMAKQTDTAFFVGTHYLTQGSPDEARQAASSLARALAVMKTANPKLLRHHQYVLPKQADNEVAVMSAMKGAWDSLSMNAVEAPPLLGRLRAAGLTALGANIEPHQDRDRSEEPGAMLTAALGIKDALALQRIHFHGLLGDLVVIDDKTASGSVDVERTRLALLRARQLASMKAANDSGEIKGPADLFDVLPVVQGRCLAAVERFADAVAARFGLDASERERVVADWHFQDPRTGQHLFFVPSRGIHDRTGGTVSLGDTIDISALVFSRAEEKPKLHPRLQTS
jgi:ADP-dependent phosphofructokinase/glucokinase